MKKAPTKSKKKEEVKLKISEVIGQLKNAPDIYHQGEKYIMVYRDSMIKFLRYIQENL